jgi:hypothetical protein
METPSKRKPRAPKRRPIRRTPKLVRDVAAERHVKAVGFWWIASGVLSGAIHLGGLLTSGPAHSSVEAIAHMIASFVFVFDLGLIAVGGGLFTLQPWARRTVIVLGVLELLLGLATLSIGALAGVAFLVVLSLVDMGITGCALWAVSKGHLFTDSYRELVLADTKTRVDWWASPLFYVPGFVIGTALAFIATVALGTKVAAPPGPGIVHRTIHRLDERSLDPLREEIASCRASGTDDPAVLARLDELCQAWEKHSTPLDFDVEAAFQACAALETAPAADEDCRSWLHEQVASLRAEQASFGHARAARDLESAAMGKPLDRADGLGRSIKEWRAVAPDSMLHTLAAERARLAIAERRKLVVEEAQRAGQANDSTRVLELLAEAKAFGGEECSGETFLRNTAEAERTSEDAVARARAIVSANDTARYPEALAILEKISPGLHPCSVEADGLRAEIKIHEADLVFDKGDWKAATGVLCHGDSPVLDPGMRAKLEARRSLWLKVVNALEQARIYAKSNPRGARAEYEKVIRLVKNPENAYRKQAEAELRALGN